MKPDLDSRADVGTSEVPTDASLRFYYGKITKKYVPVRFQGYVRFLTRR